MVLNIPFLTWDNKSQYRFKVNVWAGLIDDELVNNFYIQYFNKFQVFNSR